MKPVLELHHFYAVVRKRAWIVAVVAILAVAGAVHQLATRVPQYQAEASMLVRPHLLYPSPVEDTGLATIQKAYRETVLNDIIQLLRSRTLSERVAERVAGLSSSELARHVTVKKIRGTDFLTVSAVHERPEQAALIANGMAEELGTFYGEMNRAEATSARKFIEEQLGLAQDRLSGAEQALVEFRTRTGAAALPEDVSRTAQRILDLQAVYDAAMLDESTARARAAAIRSRLASQKDAQLASISIASNPVIAQIRDHLTGLELELASLRQVYTDQHPKVQAMLGRIADDRERLRAEGAKALDDTSLGISPTREQFVREMISAEVDAAAARARAAGISPILSRLRAGLSIVSDTELTLARLQRDVRNAEQFLTRLSSLRLDALIRENEAGSSGQAAIVVVDPAMAPDRPVPTQLPEMATLAGLLGLFIGAVLALAVENLEDRIRSSRRAQGAFGAAVLAAIPMVYARSCRSLTTAVRIANIFLIIFVVLMVGMGTGLHVAQAGTTPALVAHLGQALMQAFHTLQRLYVAHVAAIPAAVSHFTQALTHRQGLQVTPTLQTMQ